eukprot:NODE_2003_length_1227_cov_70.985569_g1662_i0.p1 GENE.NODE_2003_length_1227_cov_70.985569_g1662_i0~~NODE_2003_length_1227_cov_70.985569_g1662_i0.p1  ORF type:complete len:269 (+),score=101.77 NODE_2003_length_1227_cov_70.985569_g1662_i0:231-1037(+)
MKAAYLLLLLLALLAVLSIGVHAQDEDEEGEIGDTGSVGEEEEEDEEDGYEGDEEQDGYGQQMHGALPTVILPNHPDAKFAAGSTVDVLIGFDNRLGADGYSQFAIRGDLRSPFDQTQILQNFTLAFYDVKVAAGEEHSLWYNFTVHEMTDPRSYALILDIFYRNEDNQTYQRQLYNGTVTVDEAQGGWDFQLLAATVIMGSIVAAAGWLIYTNFTGKSKKPSMPRALVGGGASPTTASAGAAAGEDEWLPEGHTAFVKKTNTKKKKH